MENARRKWHSYRRVRLEDRFRRKMKVSGHLVDRRYNGYNEALEEEIKRKCPMTWILWNSDVFLQISAPENERKLADEILKKHGYKIDRILYRKPLKLEK